MPLIQTEFNDQIGTIIFSNPDKKNALSKDVLNGIINALDEFKKQDARAVILRAPKGSKVWSSGHDVHELAERGHDPLAYDNPLESAIRAIEHFPAPVIALIEGTVWGGACEIAFNCDILIATPDVTLAITPAKIGVPYNPSGLLRFLNMLEMSTVKEMFYTAKPISAERAERLGILNHIVPNDKIEDFVFEIAKQITRNSPLAITVIKEQLRILGKAHPLSPETFERIQLLRSEVFGSNDYKEGIEAFLEKRRPVFKGN